MTSTNDLRTRLLALLDGTTPGPWETDPTRGYVVRPVGPSFDWVATAQVSNVPNWEANARLIAAAPEAIREAVAALDERDARIKALLKGFGELEQAATTVAHYGAQTGSQWVRLSSALISARNLLTNPTPAKAQSSLATHRDDA